MATNPILSVEISPPHRCYEVQSEKQRLLEAMKRDFMTLNWQHQTAQRLSDTLFKRAISQHGDEYIDRTGFPKAGIRGPFSPFSVDTWTTVTWSDFSFGQFG